MTDADVGRLALAEARAWLAYKRSCEVHPFGVLNADPGREAAFNAWLSAREARAEAIKEMLGAEKDDG